jgi:twinkle protein
LEGATPGSVLIVTEGELDALAVLQAGYQYVVSLPSGAADNLSAARRKVHLCFAVDGTNELKSCLSPFGKIVLLTDGDRAGIVMREALIGALGEELCWVPEYADGCKDAGDVLRSYGVTAVYRLVEDARRVKSDGFVPLLEAKKRRAGKIFELGIDFLSPHLKLTKPELLVIGGYTNDGKSTVAQVLLANLLWNNTDLHASIFHGEGDVDVVQQRFKKFARYQIQGTHFTAEMKVERDAWVNDRIALIEPPQGQRPTFKWLLWAIEEQALHRGRNVFLSDTMHEQLYRTPTSERAPRRSFSPPASGPRRGRTGVRTGCLRPTHA